MIYVIAAFAIGILCGWLLFGGRSYGSDSEYDA